MISCGLMVSQSSRSIDHVSASLSLMWMPSEFSVASSCSFSFVTFFTKTPISTKVGLWNHSWRILGFVGAAFAAGAGAEAGMAGVETGAEEVVAGVGAAAGVGAGVEAGAATGGASAFGFLVSTAGAPPSLSISASHLRIQVLNWELLGSNDCPFSNAVFALSYSSMANAAVLKEN